MKRKIFTLSVALLLIPLISSCDNNIDYGYDKEESRFTARIDQAWEDAGVDEYEIIIVNSHRNEVMLDIKADSLN